MVFHYQEKSRKWQLYIESPDGIMTIQVWCSVQDNCDEEALWSPNGEQVISKSENAFWLTNIATKQIWQINLPIDASLIRWEGR